MRLKGLVFLIKQINYSSSLVFCSECLPRNRWKLIYITLRSPLHVSACREKWHIRTQLLPLFLWGFFVCFGGGHSNLVLYKTMCFKRQGRTSTNAFVSRLTPLFVVNVGPPLKFLQDFTQGLVPTWMPTAQAGILLWEETLKCYHPAWQGTQ